MRVHTKITMSMATGQVLYEEGFDHPGPLAHCKGGGGGSTNTVSEGDKEYNARMATISEAQQTMAEEYYQYWQDVHKPMETEMVAANRQLIPGETELSLAQLAAQQQLLPGQVEAGQRAQTLALQGVDGDRAAREAAAGVASQFAGVEGASLRELSRRGMLDPNQATVDLQHLGIERAKASAQAQTAARNQANTDSFQMLNTVAGNA